MALRAIQGSPQNTYARLPRCVHICKLRAGATLNCKLRCVCRTQITHSLNPASLTPPNKPVLDGVHEVYTHVHIAGHAHAVPSAEVPQPRAEHPSPPSLIISQELTRQP